MLLLLLVAAVCRAEAESAAERPVLAHVFTYADQFTEMLCHLARTVEAAGGWLHVLGLRDGQNSELPAAWAGGRDLGPTDPSSGEVWHFPDKTMMMKKHFFLWRALKKLPPNDTVVFVDAFDVLFQRPLEELVATFRLLAAPAAAAAAASAAVEGHAKRSLLAEGHWPVIYGGERNCWPFPHDGKVAVPRRAAARSGDPPLRVHEIPPDAALSANHSGQRRFSYGRGLGRRSFPGKAVCSEWLLRQHMAAGGPWWHGSPPLQLPGLPFLCAGTFVGTAAALRRLYVRLFALYAETHEYHDQALLQLLLLRQNSLGLVDVSAQLFLNLHGFSHEELERPLCFEGYFARRPLPEGTVATEPLPPEPGAGKRPPGQRGVPPQAFSTLRPPPMVASPGSDGTPAIPTVLHFNGNGKRHLKRCVEEFNRMGVLGFLEGKALCTFYDGDRHIWSGLAASGVASKKVLSHVGRQMGGLVAHAVTLNTSELFA